MLQKGGNMVIQTTGLELPNLLGFVADRETALTKCKQLNGLQAEDREKSKLRAAEADQRLLDAFKRLGSRGLHDLQASDDYRRSNNPYIATLERDINNYLHKS